MIFSPNKQSGIVFAMPILWIAVAIGFVSVKVLNSNESPTVEVSKKAETYKQVDLQDIEQREVTGLSMIEKE